MRENIRLKIKNDVIRDEWVIKYLLWLISGQHIGISIWPATDYLNKKNTKTIYISLPSQLPSKRILRRQVAPKNTIISPLVTRSSVLPKKGQRSCNSHCSSNPGGDMADILGKKLCQTKIRYSRWKIFVQEYVAGLHISVNDMWRNFLMKIGQTLGYLATDSNSGFPVKLDFAILTV